MLANGIVRTINGMKKYGFISSHQYGEFFFHKQDFQGFWDDLENDFNKGQEIKVEFTIGKTEKGPRALEVKRTKFLNEG